MKKTVSGDEINIKKAKVAWLSFVDRFIIALLFVVGAVAALVAMNNVIEIASLEITFPVAVCLGLSVFFFAVLFVLLIVLLFQKIFKTDVDSLISKRFLMENLGWFVVLGGLGALGYFVMADSAVAFAFIAFGALIVFAALVVLFALLRYFSIQLFVTDKRVFGRINYIRTRSFDIPLKKVDDVTVKFSFFGKIFNYATVEIISVNNNVKYKYIKSAEELKNEIIDFIDINEKNGHREFIEYTADCISKQIASKA